MTKNGDCEKLQAVENSLGRAHGHIHEHLDNHLETHIHPRMCPKDHPDYKLLRQAREDDGHASGSRDQIGRAIVTIRSHSGLSGDMLLAGLSLLNLEKIGLDPQSADGREWLRNILLKISPALGDSARLVPHSVNGIAGWRAQVDLPHEHEHRNLEDIRHFLFESRLSAFAVEKAVSCFELLAECEAEAHGIPIGDVHFHEVGALDSILDICGVCELCGLLEIPGLVCNPLPMADGQITCAHGVLPAPAPATLRLLRGVPVRPFEGDPNTGELVTPTAIALLRTLGARFGGWPKFKVGHTAIIYGQREFPGAPNGVIFALGTVTANS